jgi:hypothetical protein
MLGVRRHADTWLSTGLLAGLVATTTMTLSYALERRVRRQADGPLDYDDSNVPALAAARLLRRTDPSPAVSRALGLVVHWAYGSLVGVAAVPLCRRFGVVRATTAFWAGITVMAGVLFPTLGGTPAPWRWRRDVVATSAAQHLVYAAAATSTLRLLARLRHRRGRPARNPDTAQR